MIAANIVLLAPRTRTEQGALRLLEPGCEYERLEKPLTSSIFSSGNEIGLLEREIGRGYPVSDQTMPLMIQTFLNPISTMLNRLDSCSRAFGVVVDGLREFAENIISLTMQPLLRRVADKWSISSAICMRPFKRSILYKMPSTSSLLNFQVKARPTFWNPLPPVILR